MSEVKRLVLLVVGVIGLFALCVVFDKLTARADTGWEGATRVENGQSLNTSQVTISSVGAATQIVTANTKTACVKIRNLNNQYAVYIGSHSGVTTATGYRLFPSSFTTLAEFNMYAFTGAIFGQGDGGSGGATCVAPTSCASVSVVTCGTNQ